MNPFTDPLELIGDAVPRMDNSCEKIFHGPSGQIPGWEHLLIDRFGSFFFVVTYSPLDEIFRESLITLLRDKYPGNHIRIQSRRAGKFEDLFLSEGCPDTVHIEEAGLKYLIHTKRGQNPGFFADMREGRRKISEYILNQSSKKKDDSPFLVLNLFAYTCSFSVAAVSSGAGRVDNWDMNGNSLNIGRTNHDINGLESRKSAYFAYDIFKSFGKIKKRGPYDLVIFDPPPQQGQSFQYRKDYPRLMMRLEQILVPGGAALFCLNATDCDKIEFQEMIRTGTTGSFEILEDVPCPPEYLGRYPDRGLKTFLATGYNPAGRPA